MRQKQNKLPDSFRQYFWDVDPATLDLTKHRRYILERLLDKGDNQATEWLRQNFTTDEIEGVVATSRQLSPKSANYWRVILAST